MCVYLLHFQTPIPRGTSSRAGTTHKEKIMLDTLTRPAPLIVALLHVHIAPPGSILMANGSRAHRTATLRATVTGLDGEEHYITSGEFQILHCSCDGQQLEYAGAEGKHCCAHLRAYRFYL